MEYKIFKSKLISLDGVEYFIEIRKKGALDTDPVREFTMSGEQPIIISYPSTERLFSPIMKSTCTIKMLVEDYPLNLYTSEPDGTSIEISRNINGTKTIVWFGFLQPNIYNQGYCNVIEELELVFEDGISILQYYDYEPNDKDMLCKISFFSLMVKISQTAHIPYVAAKDPLFYDKSNAPISLEDLFISEGNFYSKEKEPWTYYEILEEICKYLSVTAIYRDNAIYLINRATYEGGSEDYIFFDGIRKHPARLGAWKSIVGDSYKMTGADMSLDDVFNKVSVKCNQYNINNLLPDLNDDKKLTNLNGAWETVSQRDCNMGQTHQGPINLGKAYYRFFEHSDWKQHCYKRGTYLNDPPVEETNPETLKKIRKDASYFSDYIMPSLMDYGFKSKKERIVKIDFKRYLTLFQMNTPKAWVGSDGTEQIEKNNYVPLIDTTAIPSIIYGDKAWLMLSYDIAKTFFINQPFITTDGSISNEIKKNEYYGYKIKKIDHYPRMVFKLRIDNKWWNGKDWQTGECVFEVGSEWLEDSSFFQTSTHTDNNAQGDLFFGEVGYKIKLPTQAPEVNSGLYFAICNQRPQLFMETVKGDYGEGGNAQTWISSISMKIVKEGQQLWSNDDIVYENVIDTENITDGPEIDLKINSDNEKSFSLSIVGRKGVGPLKEVKYNTSDTEVLIPEEHIVQNYVNQYSTPSIKENVTLSLDFNLFDVITDNYWNKRFVATGTEVDLQYDRQTLNLIEKK